MYHSAKSHVATASLAAEYLPTRQLARPFRFDGLALIGTAALTIYAKIKVDLLSDLFSAAGSQVRLFHVSVETASQLTGATSPSFVDIRILFLRGG